MAILRFIYAPQVEGTPSGSFARLRVHRDILGQYRISPELRLELGPGGQRARSRSWKSFRAVRVTIRD